MESYNNARYEEIRAQREARRQIRGSERVAAGYETAVDDDEDIFAERPRNGFAKVLMVQGIACVALLLMLLLARGAMPNIYRQLQRTYSAVMQTDMSVREVWAAVGSVFGNLREDIYVVAPHREPDDRLDEAVETDENQPEDYEYEYEYDYDELPTDEHDD
ncbi:MAG: hypothetical protein FWB76_03490 [Oscillospiraceae bacterium]|nr:hypothetical protein [Oscillospiraceae bacterium]